MAVLESLVLFVLVPIGAAAVSILVLNSAAQETLRSFPTGAIPDRGRSRIPVAFALAIAPIPLGLVLWTFTDPVARGIDAGTFLGGSAAGRMLFWAATAFAFAVVCFCVSMVLCIRSRMGGFLGSDFGRILPVAVTSFTGVIFALVLGFLLAGYLVEFLPGGASAVPALPDREEAVVGALQAYTVATLAFPAAALASNRVRDMSQRGFMRAVIVMELGEVPVLAGLILGFLALTGLQASVP